MARVRYMPDVEELFVTLTERGMSQVAIATKPDVDVAERLPYIVIVAGNGNRLEADEACRVWNFTVHFMIVAAGDVQCSDLADELYELVWSWGNPWNSSGTIAGVGAITEVEDISTPARTATTVSPAGDLTQYDATFSINVRNA